EGGTVRSADGVFSLHLPPGALPRDTVVSIRELPRAEWPAALADAEPLAGVYDIQPDGLVLAQPAYAVHHWSTAPAALGPRGDRAVVTHRAHSGDTLEDFPTTVVH